jgi:anti-sigma regulatory factor (Ser/Thr protein kinase)
MVFATLPSFSGLLSPDPMTRKMVMRETSRIPHFFALSKQQSIEEILSRPYSLFMETGNYLMQENSLFRLLAKLPDFALNVTNITAYEQQIAQIVAENLHTRFGLQRHKSMEVLTCLQEALLNAIIHGNLEIDSRFDTIEDFEAHYRNIQDRLTEAPYCHRRITIGAWYHDDCLTLTVTDEGKGFVANATDSHNEEAHGRGLMLIRSLADKVQIGEDRRSLCMTFLF